MSSRTKKTFAWLWMAALLTATIGVSVKQIYCYCLGKTTISLFAAQDDCALKKAAALPDVCCSSGPKVASCCQQDGNAAEKGRACTQKSTQVFQLKTEFLVDQPFEKNFDCPAWFKDIPMFRRYFRTMICEAVLTQNPESPPPPLSGRSLCVRHQLYRC